MVKAYKIGQNVLIDMEVELILHYYGLIFRSEELEIVQYRREEKKS